MNEELMNYEVEPVEVEEAMTNEGSGIGKTVLIGAGVVGAGFALYKLGKKVIGKIKAKKSGVEVEAKPADEAAEDSKVVVIDGKSEK